MSALGSVELLFIVAIILLFLSIFPALLKWLWKITMPEVFGLKQVTFWQSLRLLIIAFLLFGVWNIGGQ